MNNEKRGETAVLLSIYQPQAVHVTLMLRSGESIEISADEALALQGFLDFVRPTLEAAA